jgi:hypothetical protein
MDAQRNVANRTLQPEWVSVPVDPVADLGFDKAFAILRTLVDFEEVERAHPSRSNAVYTTSVILWMLVYQRLNPDRSLEAAVKQLIENPPDLLPENVRVTEGTLSTNTGAYSQARTRLPVEASRRFAERVSQSLIEVTPPSLGTRRVYVFDGSTFTLAPESELQKDYPPASNQHGVGVWPVALMVVAHELASGAALIPEIGAMYGAHAVSETALIHRGLAQMPPDSVAMADSAFGIFTVAYAAHRAGHKHVLRVTPVRFEAMRRTAQLISKSETTTTWELDWRPSTRVRRDHPELPAEACLKVRLHAVQLHDDLTLYLVSDLSDSAQTLSDLYQRRTDVEIDIRNLKIVLDIEHIRARSPEMFLKEMMTSQVAYNLVIQFRRQAAALAKRPPRGLSFKRTWTTFRTFLLSSMTSDPAHCRQRYRLALHHAQRDKLPNREGRHYDREVYKKRPKSTHFKTRKPPRDPPQANVK